MTLILWRDDLPDAEDLAGLEAEMRAATVDPHQGVQECRNPIWPGGLCSVCWTDHTTREGQVA